MFFIPALLSFGQSAPSRRMCGLTLGGLFPVGAFNDHVSQDGYGLDAYYGWRLRRTPVFMGLELSMHIYGHVNREVYLEEIPEVPLHVVTENNIGQTLLFLRLQPRGGKITTFIEGVAGVSYIWTDSTITGAGADNDVATETNFDDTTWTAGAGAGLSVRVGRSRVQGSGRGKGAFLELKVRYQAGGRADYLKKGSLVVEGNELSFTAERSATSFVTAQVGFSYFF